MILGGSLGVGSGIDSIEISISGGGGEGGDGGDMGLIRAVLLGESNKGFLDGILLSFQMEDEDLEPCNGGMADELDLLPLGGVIGCLKSLLDVP